MKRFNPRTLFAASEPGAWYDPSDMSTLWQDSAGTTPVTAVEQPVGRILDKSGRGNHATQATTTKRPVLSRRVNLLTKTEYPGGVTDAPIRGGNLTATTLAGYGGALHFGEGTVYAYKSNPYSTTTPIVFSVVVLMDDGGAPIVNSSGSGADFMLVVNGDAVIGSVASMGGGLYRITSPVVSSGGNPNTGISKYGGNSGRSFKATAYDLRLAIDAHLPYQWVNTATDYDADPAKFPAYLRFDGVDDALQTGNIDFTGTDKMTVWAGVNWSNTGNTYGTVTSHNGTGFNSFFFEAPGSVSNIVRFVVIGDTGNSTAVQGGLSASAYSAVLTAIADLSGVNTATLRRDGIQLSASTAVTGGGTFKDKQLFIGANVSGRYLNGRLYSLIVRGAQTPLSQIEATEAYTKQKMRLP